MPDDVADLTELNLKIVEREAQGQASRGWFEDLLASAFAFKRARVPPTVDDRETFLAKLKVEPPRRTRIEKIAIYGDRAVVACTVEVAGDPPKQYHNLRLFFRDSGRWKLLAWANEEAGSFLP